MTGTTTGTPALYLVHASSQPFVDGARGLAEFGAFTGMVG